MADSGPSVYASNPGAPRPRRRLALAAAAALAIFGLGLLIGALAFRTTGRSSSPTTATTSSGRAGAGPTTVVNGVPVGYARTRPGAVAAATEYVTLLSGSAVLENAKIQAILEQIVAPKALPELRSGYKSVTQLVRRKLGLGTKSG